MFAVADRVSVKDAVRASGFPLRRGRYLAVKCVKFEWMHYNARFACYLREA